MSRALLYAIVFIEGFCSLGAEVIALRRLVPHVGSSIVITAPTIGFFLLALALGYASGARVAADYTRIVARNFLISAMLAGIGLAGLTVDGIFAHLQPTLVAYLFFMGSVLCPLAWLLGQTVPILTNLMQADRTGEASGMALYWSTLGSFLGSVTLSLVIMQWLGVSAAVFACATLLSLGTLLLAGRRQRTTAGLALCAMALAAGINYHHTVTADTAYADYLINPVHRDGLPESRAFMVNQSLASLIDDSEPPNYTRYIRHLRQVLLDDLGFRNRDILILGAGGFTLSHREPSNRYTYVDIDPKILAIAEKDFLREKALGEFIADDARHFIATTQRRFDAIVVDVYSSHTSIPTHLVTREFWNDTRQALKPDGVLLANLILDGKLATPYARNMLATIESIFGRCSVDVLHKGKPLANVEVTCFGSSQPSTGRWYVDEKNQADLDRSLTR